MKKTQIPLFDEKLENTKLHSLEKKHEMDIQKLVELINLLIDDVSNHFHDQVDIDQHFKNGDRYPRPKIFGERLKGQVWIKALIEQYIKDVSSSASNIGGFRGFQNGADGLHRLHLDHERKIKSNAGKIPKALLEEFKHEVSELFKSHPRLVIDNAKKIIEALPPLLGSHKREKYKRYLDPQKSNNQTIIRQLKEEYKKS